MAINRTIKLEMKEHKGLLKHFRSTLLSPRWIWGFVSYYLFVRVRWISSWCGYQQDNQIGDEEGQRIAEALHINSSLTTLGLGVCFILFICEGEVNLIMMWLSTGQSNWSWRSAIYCWSTLHHQLFSHHSEFVSLFHIISLCEGESHHDVAINSTIKLEMEDRNTLLKHFRSTLLSPYWIWWFVSYYFFCEGEGESHHDVVAINSGIKLEMKERKGLLKHFRSTLLSPTCIWGFVSYYLFVRVKVNLIMMWLSTGQSNWRWRSGTDCWSTSDQLFSHQVRFESFVSYYLFENEGESHHDVDINSIIKLEMKEWNGLLEHFRSTLLSPSWICQFVSYYLCERVKVNLIMMWLSTGQSNWSWRSTKDCWSTSDQLFSHHSEFESLVNIYLWRVKVNHIIWISTGQSN